MKRDKVLLLHGWGGSDYPHWQSWLAGELAKDYGTVSFPLIQHPHFPHINRWKKEVRYHLEDFRPDTVVCHSLANTLWFHLCNEGRLRPVERLLLVAPPKLDCEIEAVKGFFPVQAPKNIFAKSAIMIVSTNDPYMPIDKAWELQEALGIPMKVIENGGHINVESGYGEWPWIFKYIKNEEVCDVSEQKR